LAQDDRVTMAASADALARQLDKQQYEYESGPCLEALITGEVVEAEDFVTEQRWRDYPAIAMAHGILAILSTPLIVDTNGLRSPADDLPAAQHQTPHRCRRACRRHPEFPQGDPAPN
jgi:hypothetical protein